MKLLFTIGLALLAVVAQYQYARHGTPLTWKWKSVLFLTGALAVFSALYTFSDFIFSDQVSGSQSLTIEIAVSLAFGVGFAWLLPLKIKRAVSPDNGS